MRTIYHHKQPPAYLYSPVHSCRKFSAVFGHRSAHSSNLMRPAGTPPIVMSACSHMQRQCCMSSLAGRLPCTLSVQSLASSYQKRPRGWLGLEAADATGLPCCVRPQWTRTVLKQTRMHLDKCGLCMNIRCKPNWSVPECSPKINKTRFELTVSRRSEALVKQHREVLRWCAPARRRALWLT